MHSLQLTSAASIVLGKITNPECLASSQKRSWLNRHRYNTDVPMQKADILVLSSARGSGHMRASTALTQGVELLAPELSCLTVDFPREVSPTTEALLRQAYLESLKQGRC